MKWKGRECLFMIAWFHLSIILKHKLFISFPSTEAPSRSWVDKSELFRENCFTRVIIKQTERRDFPSGCVWAQIRGKVEQLIKSNNQQIIIWLTERKMGNNNFINFLPFLSSAKPQHAARKPLIISFFKHFAHEENKWVECVGESRSELHKKSKKFTVQFYPWNLLWS